MFKTYTFPSVFEGNNTDLRNVSSDLINGLKVYHNGDGLYPRKSRFNRRCFSTQKHQRCPDELDYDLFKIWFTDSKSGSWAILLPFHRLSILLFRSFITAANLINQNHVVEYDAATYGGRKNVQEMLIMFKSSQRLLCYCLKKRYSKTSGNFFVMSLGYGTLGGAPIYGGRKIAQRNFRLLGFEIYAVNLLEKELGFIIYSSS